MADIQKPMIKFHDKIKLGTYDEEQKLRDRRDTILQNLKDKLDDDVPDFVHFNQGSYAMDTGVKPIKDDDFDIDVGLVFDCTKDKYPNPVDLKKKIKKALELPNRTVRIRRPCVTVEYMKDGKVDYHVDLAVYVKIAGDTDPYHLAIGREHSDEANRGWQRSLPKTLKDTIVGKFSDAEERAQYRRVIRYFKRWRDNKFNGDWSPISIGLTSGAYHWFSPVIDRDTGADDLVAFKRFVTKFKNQFFSVSWNPDRDDKTNWGLSVQLPVDPFNNLYGDLLQKDVNAFKTKIDFLEKKLQDAIDEPLPEKACKIMQDIFGDEFDIPAKADTAKQVGRATAGASTSA